MITVTQIKVQLRDLNGTIKYLKELSKEATYQRQQIMDMIIQARQSQLALVTIGQRLYPQINWMNKAFEPIKLGAIKRSEILKYLHHNRLS